MYQGLTFGVMVVVAVGTALYYLVRGSGPERPQCPRGRSGPSRDPPRCEKPSRIMLERRQKRKNVESKDELEDDECSICQDSLYKAKLQLRVLACGHEFHHKCLTQWFSESKNMTCPNCREPVYD